MAYKLSCGCTPDASGFGYCGACVSALRNKIWKEMSPERKAFDRHVAPMQSAALDEAERDYESSCSCHINPPCSYCTSGADEDEE